MVTQAITSISLPVKGEYRIDTARCSLTFHTRHLFGLAAVRGTFALREGAVAVAKPVASDSWARAVISAASFHTGNAGRDATVVSGRMLDVERYPDIVFASTGVQQRQGRWLLAGRLTVRDVTRDIEVWLDGCTPTDTGFRASATAVVDRFEFGIRAVPGLAGRHLELRLDIAADRV